MSVKGAPGNKHVIHDREPAASKLSEFPERLLEKRLLQNRFNPITVMDLRKTTW